MSIGHHQQTITAHFYQPSARFGHCTTVLGDKLYLWGGKQDLLPAVHSSKEKTLITSRVEVFHLLTGYWEQFPTTGQPPLAVVGYACTSVENSLYYFGGYCNHGNCYHNSLHQLEVLSMHWNQLLPSNPAQSPMRKWQCGMAHITDEGETCLVVIGGYGLPPCNCCHAQYVEGLFDTSKGTSNEVHVFSLTKSCWYCPRIIGDAPPPSNSFLLSRIGPDKLVFFGGYYPAEVSRGNLAYILHFTRKMAHWQKVVVSGKLGKKQPVGRCDHAGTSFSTGNSTQERRQTSFFLLSLGGIDDAKKTLSECWVLDLVENQWRQLFLPDEVSQRLWHSVSVYPLSLECVLMLVFGGRTALMKPAIADTYVVELVRNYSGQWAVEEVLDTSTLATTDHYKSILGRHMQDSKPPSSTLPSSALDMAALEGGSQSYQMLQLLQDYHERATEAEKKAEQLQSQKDAAENRAAQQEDIIKRLQAQLSMLQSGSAQQQQPKEEEPHWLVPREEVQLTDEVLGAGAWGEVRVAQFRGQRVAAKFLHGVIISSYSVELFTREMTLAAQLHHPNLVQFLGASRDGEPMILLELMPSCLRKELEKNFLTHVQITSIAEDVASGLKYLHCWQPHPIVHRDVSSANILLDLSDHHGWKAKLSDFGSANFVHQLKTAAPGNPSYAAPEAVDPTRHSTKMDIYSFGMLLVEMCIRKLPAIDPSERELQIVSVTWPQMLEIVVMCTAQQPDDRPSANQLVGKLQLLTVTT